MGLEIALVKFLREKKLFVVKIDDIIDLKPKHKDDFKKDKLYSVNWPILRREGSSPTAKSEPFLANVLLLAGSKSSMINQAAKAKLKLPSGFSREDKQLRELDSASMIKMASSKRAKQAVNAAMATECEKRLQSIMQTHLMNENNILKMQEANMLKLSGKDNITSQAESERNEPTQASQPESEGIEQTQASERGSEGIEQTQASEPGSEGIKQTQASQPGSEGIEHTKAAKIRRKLFKRKEDDSVDSEGDETCSYVSSVAVKRQLEDKIIELQSDLASERKRARILETELELLKKDFNQLDELCSTFANQSRDIFSARVPVRCSPCVKWILSPSDKLNKGSSNQISINSPVKAITGKPVNSAKKKLFSHSMVSSPKAKHWDSFTDKIGINAQGKRMPFSPSSRFSSPEAKNCNSTPSKILNNDLGDVMNVDSPKSAKGIPISESSFPQAKDSKASPENFLNNVPNVVQEVVKSPLKRPISESKSLQGNQSKKKKKEKDVTLRQSLAADELNNRSIGALMFRIFKKSAAIQDNGKHVNIGNNTWIKKEVWEKHFLKPDIKHSLLVKDLAEEIWGWRKCGMMSLSGGKSPKTPDADLKPAAPLGAVEAILGVYRAKLMTEGITADSILDDLVETKGRNIFLRGKFQDCAKKLKKEQALLNNSRKEEDK